MEFEVRKITETDIDGFHQCLDSVAREGKYIARENAPDIKNVREFVIHNIKNNVPQHVAIAAGDVVGWCDSSRYQVKSLHHCAELGMGVQKKYRSIGIGNELLRLTIEQARRVGIKRIDLDVREDNTIAIELYKKHGFEVCGRKKTGIFLEGKYFDLIGMGIML